MYVLDAEPTDAEALNSLTGTLNVAAGEELTTVTALSSHVTSDNLLLRWNGLPDQPADLDIAVHFHGFGASPLNLRQKASAGGADLSTRSRPTLALIPHARRGTEVMNCDLNREQLQARGLSSCPADNQTVHSGTWRYAFPAVSTRSELERLITQAAEGFAARHLGGAGNRPRTNRLILTGHSGGGAPIATLMTRHSGHSDQDISPNEIHLFDATYSAGTWNGLKAWATARIAADAARLGPLAAGQRLQDQRANGCALRVLYFAGTDTAAGAEGIALALAPALAAVSDVGVRTLLATFYRVDQAISAPRDGGMHGVIPRVFGPPLLSDATAMPTVTETVSGHTYTRSLSQYIPAATPARSHGLPNYGALDMNAEQARQMWEQRIADSERTLAGGFMPAVPLNCREDLLLAQSLYASGGLQTAFADHQRRLEAVFSRIRAWIDDKSVSAVGQIRDPALRTRMLSQNWSQVHYPGANRASPVAAELFHAMAALVPERRVTQIPFVEVAGTLRNVTGTNPVRQLFPDAADAFERMRAAAGGMSVPLVLGSAHRSRLTQQQIANAHPGSGSVAHGRSAHEYGLAIDMHLSVAGLTFVEACVTDAACSDNLDNMFGMYRSPVYKWMYLFAVEFGWYPWSGEPWHWEYNPPGFGDRFAARVAQLRPAHP